jgi:hypothetical protein
MHDITVLDSNIGAGAMIGVAGSAEYKHHASSIYDMYIYGETESPNCPSAN